MENIKTLFNSKTKILFILFSILFVVPTYFWYSDNGSILGFNNFLYNGFTLESMPVSENIYLYSYFAIFAILGFLNIYLAINHDKYFKTKNEIFGFITIVSAIFVFILPFVSQDVFFYFGGSRLFEHFHISPYSTTILNLP